DAMVFQRYSGISGLNDRPLAASDDTAGSIDNIQRLLAAPYRGIVRSLDQTGVCDGETSVWRVDANLATPHHAGVADVEVMGIRRACDRGSEAANVPVIGDPCIAVRYGERGSLPEDYSILGVGHGHPLGIDEHAAPHAAQRRRYGGEYHSVVDELRAVIAA